MTAGPVTTNSTVFEDPVRMSIFVQMVLVLTERASLKSMWRMSITATSIIPILVCTLGGLFAITYVPAFDAALRLAPLHFTRS